MSDTNLDWTFDNIPADDEPATLPAVTRPLARAALRRKVPAWLWVAVPAVALAALLGVIVMTRLGWARLHAQVIAEVVYEDERSAARDAAAVAAVQAGDVHWRSQREAEAQLGLAAPLPAPNLLPTGAAPRVTHFATVGDDVFEATVVRQYADSFGHTYEFELIQRYHNLGPGLWERLPGDTAALANTTIFAGEHLSATFPVADLPWLSYALPQFERALARACVDWQCPADYQLAVVFSPQINSVTGVLRTRRPPAQPGHGYPIIFDVPALAPSYPGQYLRLPSPHVAGYPRDAQAAAALTRATTVRLLAAVAAELSGENRRVPDHFLDALIARAESRLGLSTAPSLAFTPYDYLAPDALWRLSGLGPMAQLADSLPLRRQALGFVNFALADQPASVDGGLLRALRQHSSPSLWLDDVLGGAAGEAQSRWRAAALGQWTAAPRVGYQGLVLVCGAAAVVVGAAGLQSVSAHPQGQYMIAAELSADGRRLAALIAGRTTAKLVVFDLEAGTQQPLPVSQPAVLLGWLAAGQLLYLEVHPANGRSGYWRLVRLRQYDPASAAFTTLLAEPVVLPWSERGLWSPDRRTLSLAYYPTGTSESDPPHLMLLAPGGGRQVGSIRLSQSGYAPAFSPSGEQLAVFSGGDPFLAPSNSPDWRLNVIDWQNQQVTTVLTAAEMDGGDYGQVGALEWSPDGRWLSFIAMGAGTGPVTFLAPAEGGPARRLDGGAQNAGTLPLGFSADSRYLAMLVYPGNPATNVIEVFDLAAPPGTPPQRYLGQSAAWSAQGHHLLMGGAAGLYTVDPASGEAGWLYDTVCEAEF